MSTRSVAFLAFLASGLLSLAAGSPNFTVHEWGTFTTVHAPDGDRLPGLEREEERLPNFVRSHSGFAPADKGWSRPVRNVTVKMETPVLYVYAAQPFRLRSEVSFIGGSISQWYPERVAGEVLPSAEIGSKPEPIDFSAGFRGAAIWEVDVLPPGEPLNPSHPDWETPQWPRARVPSANVLRGPKGEREGFIFYRGVGNFALPLHLSFDADGDLLIENSGAESVPFVWIYDHRAQAGGRYDWSGPLDAGERRRVGPAKVHFGPDRTKVLRQPLIEAGLSEAETDAMLATWRESYFEREGLRVFWIVPRAFTDRVLPLKLDPAPTSLERVLVGRSELITPDFAADIEAGFRADGGALWREDRYFGAYRALAEKRGAGSRPSASATRGR